MLHFSLSHIVKDPLISILRNPIPQPAARPVNGSLRASRDKDVVDSKKRAPPRTRQLFSTNCVKLMERRPCVRDTIASSLLVRLLIIAPAPCCGLVSGTPARYTTRSTLAVGRGDREVDVLLRIHTHHELGDIHQLLANTVDHEPRKTSGGRERRSRTEQNKDAIRTATNLIPRRSTLEICNTRILMTVESCKASPTPHYTSNFPFHTQNEEDTMRTIQQSRDKKRLNSE